MKLFTLIALLATFQAFSQSFQESELKTSIKAVTVFLQGAQITRTGKSEVKEGRSILIIKSLSPHIDQKSIQVKATGDFTILSVNHKFDYLNEQIKDKRIDSLKNLIESLELEISSNEYRLVILKEKLSLLDANKNLGGENSGASLTQLKQAIEFFDKELSTIKKEELETSVKIRKLNERRSKIEKQVSDVTHQDDWPTGEIEIRVEADIKTSSEFNISYLVANAGWYPNYDVRVSNIENPIQLSYKADVYQNTGVDWNDVKLRFSNGNPNQSGVAPELATWYLNYARNTIYSRTSSGYIDKSVRTVSGKVIASIDGEPLPGVTIVVKGSTVGTVTDIEGNYQLTLPNNSEYLVFSFIGMNTMELPINNSQIDLIMEESYTALEEVVVTGYALQGRAKGVDVRGYSAPKIAKTIVTTAVENQTTVEFEVEQPYSIKSNGTKLTIGLNKFEIETVYEYYAVPKLDKDAFLIARIVDWDQYNLLEGEANLFFEDSFVGRSVLDANTLTDTLDISLGRDRSIVIGRIKKEEFSKRRTVGSNKIDTRRFEIIVRNNKSQAIKLTLFDQIPIAAISNITVTSTELSNGQLNEETGGVTWEMNLSPQEQTILSLGYEVKYPKKEKVNLE